MKVEVNLFARTLVNYTNYAPIPFSPNSQQIMLMDKLYAYGQPYAFRHFYAYKQLYACGYLTMLIYITYALHFVSIYTYLCPPIFLLFFSILFLFLRCL